MNSLAQAMLRSGLIDPEVLHELRRWGLPVDEPTNAKPHSFEELEVRIQEAIEGEDFVLVRETDLEVLSQYLSTIADGTLHVVIDVGEKHSELKESDIPVTFGRTPLGEYIFAWTSSAITDILTNGATYLLDVRRVFFGKVRELFFGDTKVFIICTPSRIEPLPTLPE